MKEEDIDLAIFNGEYEEEEVVDRHLIFPIRSQMNLNRRIWYDKTWIYAIFCIVVVIVIIFIIFIRSIIYYYQ